MTLGVILMVFALGACGSAQDDRSSLGEASQQGARGASSRLELSGEGSRTSGERVLACLGDSITYGHGVADPSSQAWPALLQTKLGADWNVVNLGVSGTTLLDEGGYPYRSTGNVERAKQLNPDVAIIMLGTNDAADSSWNRDAYRNQLAALMDELKGASSYDVQLVLMAPPCTFYGEAPAKRHVGINDRIGVEIRAVVRELAAEKGAGYVDLFAFTEGHPEWFPDHLHPDEAGNRAIADYVFSQLEGQLDGFC